MKHVTKLFLFVGIMMAFIGCNDEDDYKSDDEIIREYFAGNSITDAIADASGIYVRHIFEGAGETVNDMGAQSVTITYDVYDLESNDLLISRAILDRRDLEWMDVGMAIGCLYMKEGGMAELYIPSYFGYGTNVRIEVYLDKAYEEKMTDDEIIQNYLNIAEIDDAIKDESGMYIRHIEEGTGELAASAIDEITVSYAVYSLDSRQLLESTASAVTFTLDDLYEGWQIGIPQMKKGETAQLFLPADLANGEDVMFFEIKLEDFTLKE